MKISSAAPALPIPAFQKSIARFIDRLQQSEISGGSRDWGVYEVAMQSFEAMQSAIARQKLAVYPPDILIEIARNSCKTLEFDRASEIIELGYKKAKERLSQVNWDDYSRKRNVPSKKKK